MVSREVKIMESLNFGSAVMVLQEEVICWADVRFDNDGILEVTKLTMMDDLERFADIRTLLLEFHIPMEGINRDSIPDGAW